jgi:hypothetical protein
MTPSRKWAALRVEANAAALPFADDTFDSVLCQDLTVFDDQVAALREMGRVAKLVAVLVPGSDPPVNEPAALAEVFATAGLEFHHVRTMLSGPGVVDRFLIISRRDPRLSTLREPGNPAALPRRLDGSMLVVCPDPGDRVGRPES